MSSTMNMCFGMLFDVEMYCRVSVQAYRERRMCTADLARIVAGAPSRYRERVAARVLELQGGI